MFKHEFSARMRQLRRVKQNVKNYRRQHTVTLNKQKYGIKQVNAHCIILLIKINI